MQPYNEMPRYVLFHASLMLSRRHFRIKVLQSLYSYFQGGEARIEVAEKNLLKSIDQVYELYYTQLSFLLELIHFYRFRMEESKTKFYPTPDEINPSHKLLNNRLIVQLQQNKDLGSQIDRYKISWTEEQNVIRKVYQKLKISKEYIAYIHSGIDNYIEDQEFVEKLFRKFIAKSPDFQFYCEERNEEDRQFILELFRKTIIKSDEWNKLIDSRTRNWELERIALTDILLIKMALTELTDFSQIPVKVTMNEYIEISKQFSSHKSKLFINGILDNLVLDLTEAKKIKKTGRGLMT
ncbi:MAG: transcription antitermination protein NusB [Bacteroidetes bacterium]|nr:transcription antitermination protein NusB [Bacteroidota bacterium]